MVDLLEDFDDVKEHASYAKEVVYRIDDLGDAYRVRIRVGRFGYDKTISKDEAEKVLAWLKLVGARRVIGVADDSVFFA